MSESGNRITRCPVCRYDLRGLPAEHRCPECGMGIDVSMKTWRMEKLSRFAFGVSVFGVVVLVIPLIDYLRGGGLKHQIVFVAVVSSLALLFFGISKIRRHPRVILSRETVAVRGRFSWRFEVFQLADLDVVGREPLVINMSAHRRTDTNRRLAPLPPLWMSARQSAFFREEFVER